jgi:hypothetical protein
MRQNALSLPGGVRRKGRGVRKASKRPWRGAGLLERTREFAFSRFRSTDFLL